MDLTLTLSFLGAAILLTLAPGPDILFVIAQSISQNSKAGIATACGLCTGLLVHITAAVLGVSAVIYASATAFAVVKYAGAAYLLYLAWQAFRDKSSEIGLTGKPHASYGALYRRGILMNVLNPKVSLFFIALLPQFVDRSAGHVSLQMLGLGGIFLVQALIIFILVSLFANRFGQWLMRSKTIARKINVLQGLLFTAIALQIAFSKR
jgi:threonine/homoserine/homoserine lactone efflux protein